MPLFILGSLLLVTGLVATVTATVSYTLLVRGRREALPWARRGVWVALGSILAAAGLLLSLFLNGRYEFDYVFNYSSVDLELRYKLSALWAGQQGSFLVWAAVGLLVAPLLIKRSRVFEPFVLAPLMAIQTAIISFMLIQNPFRLRLDAVGNVIQAADGRGLNELLHNPWMVIHPPILFTGYGLLAVPFAYAIAGLWRRDYDGWAKAALPWTLTAWVVLSTALTLGGYWAYETLGWGGYWAWDPVENASLLPWLTASALLHGLVLQRSHGGLRRANLTLAITTYALVMYASYLTRSGVLSEFSVHSFTEEGLGRVMASILIVGIAVCGWLLVNHWRSVPINKLSERFWSRDSLFVLGMLTFVIVMIVVAFGTSMPLISRIPALRDGLREGFASAFDIAASADGRFSLQPSFFSKVTPPFGLVIIVLMTIAPLLGWRGGNLRMFVRALRWPAVFAVGVTVVALLLGVRTLLNTLYVGLGAFGLAANAEMIRRTVRGGWMRIGGYVSHIGAACLVIGFVGSAAYSSPEERLSIPLGETQEIFGHAVTFEGYALRTNSQGAQKGVIDLEVHKLGTDEHIDAAPMLHLNERDGQWLRNPAIVRRWWGDVYISPGEYLDGVDPNTLILAIGQTGTIGDYRFTLQQLDYALPEDHNESDPSEVTIIARLTLTLPDGTTTTIRPALRAVADVGNETLPAPINPEHSVQLERVSVEAGQVMLKVDGLNLPVVPARADIFVSTKPAVGLVWVGTVVMTLGASLAATRRFIDNAQRRRALQTGALPVPAQVD